MVPSQEAKHTSILGMKNELYRFITVTLIVVDVILVSTLTYTSSHPVTTFFLYISFPAMAILAMKSIEKINKPYPFIMFCTVSPLILGSLCYFSGLSSPGWLTTFPLVTITLLILDSLMLKIIYQLLYLIALAGSCLLIGMDFSTLFYIILAIGIYSAVLERCLNYFRMQQIRIEAQKKLIEEKNQEVMDSIRYARRIQTSLLPTTKYFSRHLDSTKDQK